MKNKSWKTTLAGIIAILGPVAATIWPQYSDAILKTTAGLTGLGLVAARDNGVSSEMAGVVKNP